MIVYLAFLSVTRFWSSVMTGTLHSQEGFCAMPSTLLSWAELRLLWQASLEALATPVLLATQVIF